LVRPQRPIIGQTRNKPDKPDINQTNDLIMKRQEKKLFMNQRANDNVSMGTGNALTVQCVEIIAPIAPLMRHNCANQGKRMHEKTWIE